MKIYCLMVAGGSLTEEICESLFMTAQDMMDIKERKMRLYRKQHRVDGEMLTEYKFGMMGAIGGIVFTAKFDIEDRTINAHFIVKPVKNRDEFYGRTWTRMPLFPIAAADPALN